MARYYNKRGVFAYIDNPLPTMCAVAGQYYRLDGEFTNETIKGFSIATGTLVYLGMPCFFEVIIDAAFTSDTVNTKITLAVFKNGSLRVGSQMDVLVTLPIDVKPIPLVDVFKLVEGDTIEIRVKSDKAGAEVTALHLTTSCKCFF